MRGGRRGTATQVVDGVPDAAPAAELPASPGSEAGRVRKSGAATFAPPRNGAERPSPTLEMSAFDLLVALQRQAASVLERALPPGARIVVPDFGNAPNCGESAMFLGLAEHLSRDPSRQLVFVGEWHTPVRAVAEALGEDGVLLFSGGNGLGDVWLEDQLERERLISAFRAHRVVLAPQSIHFSSTANFDRARDVLNGHPDLTVLCRDARSVQLARRNFDARVELCPDAALLLGPQNRPVEPSQDVIWLARYDHERLPSCSPQNLRLSSDWSVSDWMSDAPVASFGRRDAALSRASSRVIAKVTRYRLPPLANSQLVALSRYLARSRVRRALNHLSMARVVVTDRLHGHILSTLLGVPHVLLPNADGKTESFFETWTARSGLAQWRTSAREAQQAAHRLLRELE
jgi:exopolysaccharide biosynthesis predicted pyruvyltransferase EpsI